MQRYFLNTDNDTHWYIIPADKREEWENWCDLPEDDENSWNVPEWAEALGGGPNQVEFENPTLG